MATETETVTAPVTRKSYTLTAEQKEAATLRREAAVVRKHGDTDKADELESQADKLAPVRIKEALDPLKVLTHEEQQVLRAEYFECSAKTFSKLAGHNWSTKRLQALAQEMLAAW